MSNTRGIDNQEGHQDLYLKAQQQFMIDIASGLFTGIFCSGLFNPWDRALYLSVKNQKPFLSVENFTSPYHGFAQAVMQRAFLGSAYYIMQAEMKSYMYPYLRNNIGISESATQFCVGASAGSMSGILTNSISAVKYHTWGQDNRSFSSSVREMWSLGGVKPFIKGTGATVGRDMIFGSTYEVLRNLIHTQLSISKNKIISKESHKKSHLEFLYNSAAAGVATIASGPLNYARNIQYATPPNKKPPTIAEALKNVWHESKDHSQKPLGRVRFFQQQFCVGWGTARVAVGMAIGQKVFDVTRSELTELYLAHSKNFYKK
jgi:hypothetical protein